MLKAEINHIAVPMAIPFAHTQATRVCSESLIFRIQLDEFEGIGECIPRQFVTGESINSVLDFIKKINIQELISTLDLSSLSSAIQSLSQTFIGKIQPTEPLNAICLIEMAIFDLIGNIFNQSIHEILKKFYLFHELQNNSLEKHIKTTQVMDLALTPLDFFEKRGPFHTLKVKVSHSLNENIARVQQVRELIGKDIPCIIDANMAWNLDDALKNIDALRPYNVTYYEEPLNKNDWINYQELRQMTGVKILLDESVCSEADAISAIKYKACDALNIRISKCGGFIRSIRLLELAKKNGLDYQIGAQVAEIGPLIAAARQFVNATSGYMAYEAGQPDRYFNKYILTPMPLVDRKTNLMELTYEPGLGVSLNNNIKDYIKHQYNWNNGDWKHSSSDGHSRE